MSNIPIAFYVLGALFTLYIVAVTWRSKDTASYGRSDTSRPRSRTVSVARRLNHLWRPRHRSDVTQENGVPDQRGRVKTGDD
jgi:hypothetical protein